MDEVAKGVDTEEAEKTKRPEKTGPEMKDEETESLPRQGLTNARIS